MKKTWLITFFILSGLSICYGQATTTYELDKDTSKYLNYPLCVFQISPLKTVRSSGLCCIIPMAIDSISVYKNPEVTKDYGPEAKNGVILVKLKPGIELITLNQLYDKFNVHEKNLPVFIDSAIVYKPDGLYLQADCIKYAKIEKEKNTGMKYISLLTGNPINRPKKGEINIRGNISNQKIN